MRLSSGGSASTTASRPSTQRSNISRAADVVRRRDDDDGVPALRRRPARLAACAVRAWIEAAHARPTAQPVRLRPARVAPVGDRKRRRNALPPEPDSLVEPVPPAGEDHDRVARRVAPRPRPDRRTDASRAAANRPTTRRSRASPRHGPFDGLELLGRKCGRGAAVVELLHVDPRVVATLDRAHDDAGARRVEQRERRRRLPRFVLVRVVAHDRRLRDAVVHPAIDTRGRRRSRRRPGADRRSA